jgi:hypothetical protein
MEICIYSTANPVKADMLKEALDKKNIANYLKNKSANTLGLGGWTVGVAGANLIFGDIKVMVKEEDSDEALEVVNTLFGDIEEDSDIEVENSLVDSNNSENNVEEHPSDLLDNDEGHSKEQSKKKMSARGLFFIFLGVAILAVFLYFSYPHIVKKITDQYYNEMFIVSIEDYNSIPEPISYGFYAIEDYRNNLYNKIPVRGWQQKIYSVEMSKKELINFFTGSGNTSEEANNLINDINLIGNILFDYVFERNEEYMAIIYISKLKNKPAHNKR